MADPDVSRPLPLQWGPTFTGIGGEGSLQFVWRTDLELDLKRTQNYCVELFALYLRRMIVEIQFSMKLLACPGAAEQMPSHGPTGKFQHVAILSLYVKGLSSQERNILNVDRPLK